ncbi:hypothetical protein [Pseudomonas baetica]|uniref:hypothetical protein n=1 Tax=Pseudomonas baetica TaxID=674054 RepID=UPI0024061831|nr:hypothetical protein [Pseudomonas baetica]MDF9779194.1 ribosome modulation factor [Pseudomonas baetica]
MLAFQNGKKAAQEGTNHDVNPYPYFSQEGQAWANGWLVGKDPENWGDLEARYTETESQTEKH